MRVSPSSVAEPLDDLAGEVDAQGFVQRLRQVARRSSGPGRGPRARTRDRPGARSRCSPRLSGIVMRPASASSEPGTAVAPTRSGTGSPISTPLVGSPGARRARRRGTGASRRRTRPRTPSWPPRRPCRGRSALSALVVSLAENCGESPRAVAVSRADDDVRALRAVLVVVARVLPARREVREPQLNDLRRRLVALEVDRRHRRRRFLRRRLGGLRVRSGQAGSSEPPQPATSAVTARSAMGMLHLGGMPERVAPKTRQSSRPRSLSNWRRSRLVGRALRSTPCGRVMRISATRRSRSVRLSSVSV